MNLKCLIGMHKWDGCQCSACHKTRNEGHEWDYCMCVHCHKLRIDGHDWSANCKDCLRMTNQGFSTPDGVRPGRQCKLRRMLLAQSLGRSLESLADSSRLPSDISGVD